MIGWRIKVIQYLHITFYNFAKTCRSIQKKVWGDLFPVNYEHPSPKLIKNFVQWSSSILCLAGGEEFTRTLPPFDVYGGDIMDHNDSKYDICPVCGSDEVYYENPNTGYGGYVCQDCGYEFPIEE